MTELTITDVTPRIQYAANAAQVDFTIPFKFYADEDLKVYLTPVGQEADEAADILTITTDYTVTGAGVEDGTRKITLTSGATEDDVITIRRDLPVKRLSDYSDVGDFLAETVNADLDKAIMMIQQLEDYMENRVLRLAESNRLLALNLVIPDPNGHDGEFLRITSDGTALEWEPVDADALTAAIAAAQAAQSAAETAQGLAEDAQAAAETAETNAASSASSAEAYSDIAAEAASNLSGLAKVGYVIESAVNAYRAVEFYASAHALDVADTSPKDLEVSPDETHLYIVASGADKVLQYDMTVPGNPRSSVFVGELDVSGQDGLPYGVRINSDGTKLFVSGDTNNTIFAYDLSTPWDITTASYNSESLTTATAVSLPSFAFSSDGTFLVINDESSSSLHAYTLSTAWDLSTATLQSELSLGSIGGYGGESMWMHPDGDLIVVRDYTNGAYYIELSTPKDITTAALRDTVRLKDGFGSTRWFTFNSSGTRLYTSDATSDQVQCFPTGVDYEMGSAKYTMIAGALNASPYGLWISPDGKHLFVASASTARIYHHPIGTAFDLSTMGISDADFSTSSQTSVPSSVVLSNDGKKMWVGATTGGVVVEYDLSTPWDLTTASYNSVTLDTSTQTAVTNVMIVSPDGEDLYVTSNLTGTTLWRYHLSTAWDLSTASYNDLYDFSGGITGTLEHGFWTPDGDYFYALDSAGAISEFYASSPWDTSTLSATGASWTFPSGAASLMGYGIYVDPRGEYLFHATTSRGFRYPMHDMLTW
jgi:sugar lactone lactonase YvrE